MMNLIFIDIMIKNKVSKKFKNRKILNKLIKLFNKIKVICTWNLNRKKILLIRSINIINSLGQIKIVV